MHALGVEAMLEKPLNRHDLLGALQESLMDREDLWLMPVSEPILQVVSIEIEAMDGARKRQFQLGRGGCSVPCDLALGEGHMIDLTVLFASDAPCLRAQAKVRWYSAEGAVAGVAFRYLDPACRSWVVGLIEARRPNSFIPSGSEVIEMAPGPEPQSHPDVRGIDAT
jgi:hypothetical protein